MPHLRAFEHSNSSTTRTIEAPGSPDVTWTSRCKSFRDSVRQLALQIAVSLSCQAHSCGSGWRLLGGQGARAGHLHLRMEQATFMLALAHRQPAVAPMHPPELPEMCNSHSGEQTGCGDLLVQDVIPSRAKTVQQESESLGSHTVLSVSAKIERC